MEGRKAFLFLPPIPSSSDLSASSVTNFGFATFLSLCLILNSRSYPRFWLSCCFFLMRHLAILSPENKAGSDLWRLTDPVAGVIPIQWLSFPSSESTTLQRPSPQLSLGDVRVPEQHCSCGMAAKNINTRSLQWELEMLKDKMFPGAGQGK